MKSYHRDPTLESAARHEARDCHGCEHLLYLWNVPQCTKEKWKDPKKMKRCDLWRWDVSNH